MSKHLHRDLDQLHRHVLKLSAMVEEMIDKASLALRERRYDIADEVAGRFPQVKILQIAWHDKRQHVRRFLLDYYAKYRCLPSGRHDLGRTGVHHLSMGIIDFDRVRRKIQIEIDYRRQAGARRRNRILSAAGRLGIRRLLSEIATTAGWRGCKS